MRTYVDAAALQEYTTKLVAKLKQLFPGTPLSAATVADMTDTSRIYVYTGSETGYTAGNWYYWDGTAWVSGGVYNSTALVTDTTLTDAGKAADAKVVGDIFTPYTATSMTAPANITAGEYVLAAGTLYKATANIASGSTLTPNGNVVAVTIGGDLTQLFANTTLPTIDLAFTTSQGLINYSTGETATSSTMDHTSYINVANYKTLTYKRIVNTVSNPNGGMAFYDRFKNYISGIQNLVGETAGYADSTVTIPSGAAYVRFSTLKNTATYGEFSASVTVTASEQILQLTEEMENKAEIDGTYDTLTAGNAKQLMSTVGVTDQVPYNFRTSGGSIDIGDREIDEVRGLSITWNQLVDTDTSSVTLAVNHQYFTRIGGVENVVSGDGSAVSVTGGTDQIHDITLMLTKNVADHVRSLETTTPGAGVAWFRKYFPKTNYAFDPGTIRSVKVSAHKMVGFNAYNNTTGTAKLVGGMQYQITGTYTSLAYEDVSGNAETITPDADGYFTPTANGTLTVTGGNGTNTCVHLVWDGEKDGQWEAYVEYEYPLDDTIDLYAPPTLPSSGAGYLVGNVPDSYASDGKLIRRNIIKDLSSYDWSSSTPSGKDYKIYYTTNGQTADGTKYIATKYPFMNGGRSAVLDKFFCSYNGRFCFRDDSLESDADAKAAMQGVYAVARYANAQTFEITPYQNPQVVDDFGTEEYVDAAVAAGTRDVAIPVGHYTTYLPNLRAKLEMAPNSPDGDGDYIVHQENGENTYVPLTDELPASPSTDGTYTLKITVTDGTPTLAWVADT